jgi:hypothetical protein
VSIWYYVICGRIAPELDYQESEPTIINVLIAAASVKMRQRAENIFLFVCRAEDEESGQHRDFDLWMWTLTELKDSCIAGETPALLS